MSAKGNNKKDRDPLETASKHVDVFANFWLSMVSASARGFAVATSRGIHPRNEAHPRSLVESVIDRAAESLAVTTGEVASAAKTARAELKRLHGEKAQHAENGEVDPAPSTPPESDHEGQSHHTGH